MVGSVRTIVRLGVVAAVVTTGVVWESSGASAASFTQIPSRLYMAPAGESIPDGIAEFIGVDVGTLVFDGVQDPISGDDRRIVVDAPIGPLDCILSEAPYAIDDCSRVQLQLNDHGLLSLGAITPEDDGSGGDAYLLNGLDVRIESLYVEAAGSLSLAINGTPENLNLALERLVFTPDDGYRYVGSNPVNLAVLVEPGDSGDTASDNIEIRVLGVNEAATIEGPANKAAQAEVELLMPPVAPGLTWPYTGSEWTVADPDNDEIVDTDDDPLPDGEGDKMLLVGYLDCGVPTVFDQTGFRLRGGLFQTTDQDIEQLLTDFYDLTSAPPEVQAAVDLLLDALNAIEPGLTSVTLATGNPTTYTDLFAGIADINEVAYALSQVRFLSDAPNDTCTLYTIVSDLGNNGLPLQYIGDPPTGFEVPFLGVPPIDIEETLIAVGGLDEITVDFDPASQFVLEGTTATATIVIDPPTHPAFDLRWSTVAGTATPNVDYQSIPNGTINVPANATSVQISTNAFNDDDPDPPRTFSFVLTPPTDPPGSPSGFTRPDGYEITSTQSTHLVTIIDDDNPDALIDSFPDVSVTEGDAGTTDMVFTIGLNQPATGTESVLITATPGSATNPEDYGDPVPSTVNFPLGATSATVTVPIVGDLLDEGDHSFTLTLSDPVDLTIPPEFLTATGTILDDDATRSASIADASVIEGDAGTVNLSFTVSLDQPAKGSESLTVSTADVVPGATAGVDYTALTNQPLTFVAGQETATVNVVVNGDTEIEPDETFTITLTSVSNVAIGTGTATGTIINDDGVIAVSVNDVTVTEGNAGTTNATFTITLAEPALGGESIRIETSDGTATVADNDYVAGSENITFVADQTTETFTVLVNGDTDIELDETFTVTLSLPVGLVITDGTGIGTILNDDDDPGDVTAPSVTVNQAAGQADPTSVSPILFTVVFSEPVVGFATGDVTLAGTAGATTAVVTDSGDATTFSVAVSGMTQSGTVIASVGAGVATDAATNPNTASTSTDNTVMYAPDVDAPLTIDVPDDIVTGNDPGEAGATVEFAPATASGGTPPLTVGCDRTSGQFFALGTTTVTCTATDDESSAPSERFVEATVTATFTITVVDTEPPVIAQPPDLVREATSLTGVTVTYATPAATDNAGPPTVTCSPASGGVFAVGATTVTCTATDAAGNSASASFTVTVTAPASGGLPVTGAGTGGVLLLAAMLVAAGLATHRIGRRAGAVTR